jgi:hypothetical protein
MLNNAFTRLAARPNLTMMQYFSRRGLPALIVTLLVGALGACGNANPMRDAAHAVGIGSEPPPAPDFVTRTRSTDYEYLPIGRTPPKRNIKAKDAGGVAGAEAEMDALRAQTEATGNQARAAGGAMAPVAASVAPPPN